MTDLNDYISRYLHPSNENFFHVEPLPEFPDFDWDTVPFAEQSQMMRPSFPRVLPSPPGRARGPMAHDGGPGVKDHSIIKRLLRNML